ncbi:hypothetical protein ACFQJ7_15360 [Halovenus rubra]|uniref:Uncharacterized protein n=2 Tax=Halovenus rubra TaxID=869890 RepID=A0ACC7E2W4_9EURY|nr:hypothetical protein [Halovenus rubra]
MVDNRAVSIAVAHGLTLAITTILISGLLLGAGDLLEAQEQRAAKAQFDEIGGDLVAQLNTLDRLNSTGDEVNVTVQPEYPEQVASGRWNLELQSGSESSTYTTASVIRIESPSHDRTIEYPLSNSTSINYGTPANSYKPVISLCNGEITFGECS